MITSSAGEATLSSGVFAALTVGIAVATLSPAHTNNDPYEWMVYSLSSDGEEGTDVPGMSVWLNNTSMDPEAQHSLAIFTVCVWFKATAFLGLSTLLSYSLASDELPIGIEFRIHPNRLVVNYMEHKLDVALKSTLAALEWYPMCLVVEPGGVSVWVDGAVVQRSSAPTSPLPLDGFLVLGQDKDALGGGYTSGVSFLGEVTGLSLWNVTLTPQHLHDWASCTIPSVEPLLPWSNFKWTLHNQTGIVSQHGEGPCTHDTLIKDKPLLFTEKMTRQDALQFLSMVGLELVIPRSESDAEAISAQIESNRGYCTTGGRRGPAAWLGVEFDSVTGRFVDTEGQELVYVGTHRDIRRNQDSSYIMQNDRGQWEMVDENTKLCFVGRHRMKKVVLRLRGLCEEDDSDQFNTISTSFVFSVHEEDGVYLHGYRTCT
ncbi:uncharacterized protein [Panulirus ornatus]|uniref:uncharacterized protein n=1 Tax=Panulirus ornatus TaxID=150431 RepID=UPI003A84D080